MSEHPNHRRQIDDGIQASLRRAGIPSKLFRATLTSIPEGDELVQWIKAEGRAFFSEGGTFVFIGEPPAADRAALLFGRALHLMGIGVRVVSVQTLVKALDGDDDDFIAKLDEAPVLVLTRFYSPEDADDRPFTRWQTMLVEDYLLERQSLGKGVVLHSYRPFGDMNAPNWWRRDFVHSMSTKVREVEIRA